MEFEQIVISKCRALPLEHQGFEALECALVTCLDVCVRNRLGARRALNVYVSFGISWKDRPGTSLSRRYPTLQRLREQAMPMGP
jgi:hypothetical protein